MASLNPLNSNLDLRKTKHLLRRTTFNYSKNQLDAFIGMTPANIIDSLTTPTTNALAEPYDPLPTGNPDGFWTSSGAAPDSFENESRKRGLVAGWWWYNAMSETSLKHKLSFFLHTCFNVAKDDGAGPSSYYYDYLRLLDFYAYGNIKTVAKKITMDNAMLVYLDNTRNNKNNPNENYAREFFELFTILEGKQIGEGNYTNYTEDDIQQATRVLSGYKVDKTRSIIDPETGFPTGYINYELHDPENKTFTEAFNNTTITGRGTPDTILDELSDFVDMVFAQPETAKAYCRKLYRYFVKSTWNEEVENDIITPLSQQLIANDYEILPVVKTLLSSEHFYDTDDSDSTDNIIGSIIKSPLQLLSEICAMFQVNIPNPTSSALTYYNAFFYKFIHNTYFPFAGTYLFSPEEVAGYPAYYQEPHYDRNWFSSNTIIGRYRLIESLIFGENTISNGSIFTILDTVLFVKNNIPDASDPNLLITELADLLYPESIDTDRTNYFKSYLVDEEFPDYYWTGAWNKYLSSNDSTTVKTRLDALITAMVNAAEFQLM
ncbi:DUF1800 domain-containing protein [Tamlana agarivorans]|uniref:DUF1800 domain-containing protein n=1 Tax=Pseudotamlana agarivorans TaxID=481183 RepID=A0ACC5U5B3_9FLAO|nr:DUF1800 family protein [Tamlana agarivorans]MBU2949448.1 DUF1800 domain-containing protein [Tamlana agarivorans]